MHGHALALFALLVLSGLLWPFARGAFARDDDPRERVSGARPRDDDPGERVAGDRRPRAAPDPAADLGQSLNPVELALIAELSLEQARGHEEVAADPTQRADTRDAAAASAAAWRERARMLQAEARRRSAHPMLAARLPGISYTGPERRRQARRRAMRRARLMSLCCAIGGRDRRVRRDRRVGDRRRPEPAPR